MELKQEQKQIITLIYDPRRYPLKFAKRCNFQNNYFYEKNINLDAIVKNNVKFLSLKETIEYLLALMIFFKTYENKKNIDRCRLGIIQCNNGRNRSIHDLYRIVYNYKPCSPHKFLSTLGKTFFENVTLRYCSTIKRNYVSLYNFLPSYIKNNNQRQSFIKSLMTEINNKEDFITYKIDDYQKDYHYINLYSTHINSDFYSEPQWNVPFNKWKEITRENTLVRFNSKLRKRQNE